MNNIPAVARIGGPAVVAIFSWSATFGIHISVEYLILAIFASFVCLYEIQRSISVLPPGAASTLTDSESYFGFTGRIGRQTYWLKYYLPIVGALVLALVLNPRLKLFVPTSFALQVFCIIASVAGRAKRCHDRNRSGWFQLIAFIPIVGQIWAFVELGCLRGSSRANRFGEDPLAQRT
jgi:uncharacterized membrane protein YhaH (DUF805 family)